MRRIRCDFSAGRSPLRREAHVPYVVVARNFRRPVRFLAAREQRIGAQELLQMLRRLDALLLELLQDRVHRLGCLELASNSFERQVFRRTCKGHVSDEWMVIRLNAPN